MGVFSLYSFLFIALYLRAHQEKLLPLLYVQAILLAIVSLLLDSPTWPYGYRLRGPTYQPNILAAHLGLGLLVGISLQSYRDVLAAYLSPPLKKLVMLSSPLLWLGQGLLFFGLWLTQSRGVLLLCLFFVCAHILKRYKARRQEPKDTPPAKGSFTHRFVRVGLWLLVVGSLLLGLWMTNKKAAQRFAPSQRWLHAFQYRLELQQHGLAMLQEVPWHGWGADGLIFVFGGLHPLPPLLQKSFHRGVRFDSTHNWFLDKPLEFGWLGGICLFFFLFGALKRGFSAQQSPIPRLLSMFLLFLCIRYLWTVSMMEIEMVFWCLLFSLHPPPET